MNDPFFRSTKQRYESLAQELNNRILACDTRLRSEYRVIPTYYSYSESNGISLNEVEPRLIWRMQDGSDIEVPHTNDMYDGFARLERIGCKEAYIAFVNEYSDTFASIDSDIKQLIKKYPSSDPYLAVGRERTKSARDTLAAFLSNQALPTVNTTATGSETLNQTDVSSKGVHAQLAYYVPLPESEMTRTDSEPETVSEKVKTIRTSSSPFLLYAFLPLVGLLLLAGIYFRTKHSHY